MIEATRPRAPEAQLLQRPVHSLVMLQGALSLWSFCGDLPHRNGTPGYYFDVIRRQRVLGPILTTQSEHDTAVGTLYPFAAGASGETAYADLKFPKYGAVGAYGARGDGFEMRDFDMLPTEGTYDFRPGAIHNLNASSYICEGGGASGAHNDIAKPEVAHAIWQAIQTPA
jgi:hypothetical protein